MRNKRFSLLVILLLVLAAVIGWRWIKSRSTAQIPEIDLTDAYPRVAEGIDSARESVRANPESGEKWGRLGMILQAHEYADEASECYANASRLDADEFRWPYYLAVLTEPHDADEAQRKYSEAVRRAPTAIAVRLRLAESLIAQGDLSEAEVHLREALKSKPTSGRALLRMAQIAMRKGQPEQARQWAEKAIEKAPSRRDCHELLAQIYNLENDREAAAKQLELAQSAAMQADGWDDPFLDEVRQQRLDPHCFAYRAKLMIESGDVPQGIELLAGIVKEHPDELSFRELLAQAYIHQGKLDAASGLLDEGLRRDPKSATMLRLRGSVSFLRQQWKAAKADYKTALQSKPDDAAAQFDLGICYLQLGENQDALRALREAVRYDPAMIVARVELARLLWQEGMKDSARAELRETRTIAPDHPLVKELATLFEMN